MMKEHVTRPINQFLHQFTWDDFLYHGHLSTLTIDIYTLINI